MDRQQVIATLESLANGVDPNTGNAIPIDMFQSDTVRALVTAATLLRTHEPARRASAEKFAAAGTPWSADEDARLAREFDEGMSVAQIALKHGRTPSAINLRLVKLGRLDPAAVRPRQRGARSNA